MIVSASTKVLNTCNNAAGGGAYVSQCKRVTFRIHPTAPDSFHVSSLRGASEYVWDFEYSPILGAIKWKF